MGDWIVEALQYIDHPEYRALLVFGRGPHADVVLHELKDDLLHLGVVFTRSSASMALNFPSGAQIRFGVVHDMNDAFRYSGMAFHYVKLFAPQSEEVTAYLRTRCRMHMDIPWTFRGSD